MQTDADALRQGWVRQLQAIAQNGLTYATGPYDIDRYRAIQRLAAEIAAPGSDLGQQETLTLFAGEVGHATPKVDVRGVAFRGDTVLLVKEHVDGLWTLPGGWADIGESPGAAVAREVYEESGFIVRTTKLLALYDRGKHGHTPHPFHIYKLFFLCEITGGVPTPSNETDEVAFFPEDAIPPLSLGRVTPAQITHFFDHSRHPDWPTDFD